jgi:hypothetical protein
MLETPETESATSLKRLDPKTRPVSSREAGQCLILLLLGAAVYLYLNLFSLPHTPYLLAGDQVYFWTYGQRMFYGDRVYLDFFQFTPPGMDLLYMAIFKTFGLHVWVTNAVVLVLGVVFCGMCFVLAKEIMSLRSTALAVALFLVHIYGRSLNGTHHWLSVLIIMVAVKICMREVTRKRIFIAGALLGLASFFTHTHGAAALLAFATFLIWKRSRAREAWTAFAQEEALLCLGFAVVFLSCNAHLLATVGWKQLWYFQVTYVLKYVMPYDQGGILGLPGVLTRHTLFSLVPYLAVYLALPLVYFLALWKCWRERHDDSFPWNRVALLSLVGSLLLIEVAFSLNWLRLYAVSLAGIILLVWILDQARSIRRYAIPLLWIVICALAVRQTVWGHRDRSQRVLLPGGEVATSSQVCEELGWIAQHTKPGQSFFQAAWPGMYLPLQLHNSVFADQVLPGETTPSSKVLLTIRQLDQKQVLYVLWDRSLDSVSGISDPAKDHIAPLRQYLHNQYHLVRTFSNGEQFWQRNSTAGQL